MGENVCVMSIFVFVLLIGLAGLMLFVRASGYLEATGPFREPGPFELPLFLLLRARGPAMQDFCCV